MKRGSDLIIILLLISFLSIGLSSADITQCRIAPSTGPTACGTGGFGENIIMGLSDANNAHGQVWNASAYGLTSYPYVVCCNFYPVIATPATYACTGTNKIIGLSGLTNAHAETPNLILYTTKVCYGSLECVSSTKNCDSSSGEVNVMNLSSVTNAHIGTGTEFNVSICCKDSSNVIGPKCDLNDATWEYQSSLEGGQVKMIVKGINCPEGTSLNFSVYQDKGLAGSTLITSSLGYFSNLTWVAKLPSGVTSANFFFKAQALISRDIISSQDGTGNKTLAVSQQPVGFCNTISYCSDYKDQQNCTSDSTLCNPPRATFDPSCNQLHKETCLCTWVNNKCSLSTSYSPVIPSCNNGFNLCYNSSMGMYYCYPSTTCPVGEETPLDGVCNNKDGCYSSDCGGTGKASCAGSATCIGRICSIPGQNPQNMTSCDNGYTLCYKGLTFCYPGSACRANEYPLFNNNGTCDPGEGCTSPDCGGTTGGDPTKLDSCSTGSYCYHGKCFSPNAGPGTCVYYESSSNCSMGKRNLTVTVSWKGTGSAPSWCQNNTKVIPCAAQVELPFFGIYQVAGAIILIIVIYLLYAFRKKIFRKKHNSRKRK